MTGTGDIGRSLRDRIAGHTEDRLGRALSDLLDSPLLSGAIGKAFDAREKAAQAQEVAMGALNLPSAADIERLTRRLRSVSHRLEAIEDGVSRLDRGTGSRLGAIEQQLEGLGSRLETLSKAQASSTARRSESAAGKPSGSPSSKSSKSRRTARRSSSSSSPSESGP